MPYVASTVACIEEEEEDRENRKMRLVLANQLAHSRNKHLINAPLSLIHAGASHPHASPMRRHARPTKSRRIELP